MNKCRKCKKILEANQFSWKNKKLNKKHTICKKCKRIVDNNYYMTSQIRKEKIREKHQDNVNFLKEFVDRIKKRNKCQKCDEDRYYVLEFHHMDERLKDKNISLLVKGCSMQKIKEEIRKCILVCANCHKEIHHKQRRNMEI